MEKYLKHALRVSVAGLAAWVYVGTGSAFAAYAVLFLLVIV